MTRASRLAGCLAAGLVLLTGCTGHDNVSGSTTVAPAPRLRLVAFDSCADLLAGLRTAAKAAVGPYGFNGVGFAAAESAAGPGGGVPGAAVPGAAAPDAAGRAAAGEPGAGPAYSGTNTHEAGVDEPDLVKTDGQRIVTVSGGVLRVVDAASRQLTGSLRLDLGNGPGRFTAFGAGQLLLSGDRALVLVRGFDRSLEPAPDPIIEGDRPMPLRPAAQQLLLVDLAGGPHVTGRYAVEGALVDARLVGRTARVVVNSTPRLPLDYQPSGTDAERVAANRAVIDKAPAEAWLPRYTVEDAGGTRSGRVDCGAVSRPAHYTGASLLTVLTFDLGRSTLGTGNPVSVAADGGTVYGTGASLYVANVGTRTELYKFDTSNGAAPPRFVAAGAVPGYLLNQYALSEWNGDLRVATTSAPPWGAPGPAKVESSVYVLRGRDLATVGQVGGLGRGERIYAVRFVGGTGYVVTFRQTDPLYTVDLRNPAKPAVTGELKINGFSAYLHPAGDGRLLGIGQDATDQGRTQGTQVSLFDVTDPAHTVRLAQYHVRYGHSEAEFDPHAFLYWPAQKLLVVPLSTAGVPTPAGQQATVSGALALHVDDSGFREVATISHPSPAGAIRRSLMIGDTLWTVSDAGLAADRPGAARLGWVPFA